MPTEPAPQAPVTARRGSPVLTLLVVLLGMFTLPMAMSGTTVALPRIGSDLDASGASLQWVVVGYFLAASSFMLVAGSLGDIFGRRRVLTTGAALYSAGTLAAAFAHHVLVLDAVRLLSGVGAAGVMASGGSLLAATFTGTARTRAFAALGTTAGIGLAIGPTFSGWLVDGLGWRATFLVFAAAGTLVLTGTRFLAESRADAPPRVDKAGAATFIGGLSLTLFAVTQGSKSGWASASTLLPSAVGLTLLWSFVRIEKRLTATGGQPILDLSLARNPAFLGWSLGSFGLGAGTTGVLVFLPTYLQGTSGTSARDAGLTLLLMTVPVLALPPLGARLVNRGVPARRLLVLSLLLIAAGNAWLTTLHPGIPTAALAGPLLTVGIGQGLSLGIIDAQALGMVEPTKIGMASGFLNTVRGGTGAVVLTLFGALLLALVESQVGSAGLAGRVTAGAGGHAGQFTEAWRIALWTVAGVIAGLALLVHRLLRPRPRPRNQPRNQPRTAETPEATPTAALPETTTTTVPSR
ncbi:MFS transporter [Streptomyces sp. KL118A]|uniref:MFS transporter n=1 Tax=Streptomyces sp. KL118A TaxID=3045153 RepID=UPI00278C5494|nr:MFS transporter [Streptomyces sp. KL118A]